MRKVLTLIGKFLIIVSLLWPGLLGWIDTSIFAYSLSDRLHLPVGNQLYSDSPNWWPLIITILIGTLLCLIAKHKSPHFDKIKDVPFKSTLLALAFKIWVWGMAFIIGVNLLILLIAAIIYVITLPNGFMLFGGTGCGALAVGALGYVGYCYYKNTNENE